MKRIIIITIAVLMAMPVFAQGAQYRKKLRERLYPGSGMYAGLMMRFLELSGE